jgi:hypothetical protein
MKPRKVKLSIEFRKMKKYKGYFWEEGENDYKIWVHRNQVDGNIINALYHEITHCVLNMFKGEEEEVKRNMEGEVVKVISEEELCYLVAGAVEKILTEYLACGMLIGREYTYKEAKKWKKKSKSIKTKGK